MIRALAVLCLLALSASVAQAHGGAYRPPNGEVPPNMRKPTDPPPPAQNPPSTPPPEEGGGTPTPEEPGAGGKPRPAPVPPSNDGGGSSARPVGPGGPGGGPGATTRGGRGNQPPPVTYDSWLFWWEFNDDDILNYRARLKALAKTAGTSSGLLDVGPVHRRSGASRLEPTEVMIETRVVPVLLESLDSKHDEDMRTGALLALAKVASTRPPLARRAARAILPLLRNRGGREPDTVEESAALALGLLELPEPEILAALRGTLLDAKRRPRTRAFAALALGLLRVEPGDESREETAHALRRVVAAGRSPTVDVPVCALVAMGLSGDAGFVPDLITAVRTERFDGKRSLSDVEVSYAASALGKLVGRAPAGRLEDIEKVLRRALITSGPHTVRSAVIALGSLGLREDLPGSLRTRVVRLLVRTARKGETQAGSFAAAALGRMGAATDEDAVRTTIFATLCDRMEHGDYNGRPFGALGLGLMGRNGRADRALRETVRRAFEEYRGDPKNRGARALALGMLRDPAAVPGLIDVLEDDGEVKVLRGAAAVALGLVGDRRAAGPVRRVLLEDDDPTLRGDCATAAGLLGVRDVIPELIRILADRKTSLYVQGTMAIALGRMGDRRAVEPLIELARNEQAQDISRALAVVALGMLGDRNDLPVLSRLSRDVNYRAQVDAIREVLTIL